MPYKVHLLDALTPVEWSQATWRVEGVGVPIEDCPFERVHALMLAHLPRGGLVLDAGCGSAKWPIYLRSLGYRVVGVDVSRDACALARSADPDLGVAVADVRRLPVKRHSVDAVLSLGVVEHDERGPDHALAEVRRVLRPGGLFALTDPSVDDLPGWPRPLWTIARRNMDDMPALDERDRLLDSAGLRVLETRPTLHGRWITLTLAERPAA